MVFFDQDPNVLNKRNTFHTYFFVIRKHIDIQQKKDGKHMKYCAICMHTISDSEDRCPFCGHSQQAQIPLHHLAHGTILQDRYLIGTAIGEGGFGITYIARDLKLDRVIAVKEYYPNGYVNRTNTISAAVSCSMSEDRRSFYQKGLERFLTEARILAKFSGLPGIVEVYDFFEANGTAYIVMEYLPGPTLKERLQQIGTLSAEETVRLLLPVMQSLKTIHSQGLIHRDISPDNIMFSDNSIKLLDFGAARNMSALANKSISVILKPGFAPEEQYRGKGNQGPWTDIYALCATMYKCITGITPDDAPERMRFDEVKAPSALGFSVAPNIETAIMRGMQVRQEDRYQTIDDLLEILTLPAMEPTPQRENTVHIPWNQSAEEKPAPETFRDTMTAPILSSEPSAEIPFPDVKASDKTVPIMKQEETVQQTPSAENVTDLNKTVFIGVGRPGNPNEAQQKDKAANKGGSSGRNTKKAISLSEEGKGPQSLEVKEDEDGGTETPKRKKKKTKLLLLLIPLIVFAIIIGIVFPVKSSSHLKAAKDAFAVNDYELAVSEYLAINKDGLYDEQLRECFKRMVQQREFGSLNTMLESFDCEDMILEAAREYINNGNYLSLNNLVANVTNEKLTELCIQTAKDLLGQADYTSMGRLTKYTNRKELEPYANYADGMKKYQEEDYEGAFNCFTKSAGVEGMEHMVDLSCYKQARVCLEKKKVDEAIIYFNKIKQADFECDGHSVKKQLDALNANMTTINHLKGKDTWEATESYWDVKDKNTGRGWSNTHASGSIKLYPYVTEDGVFVVRGYAEYNIFLNNPVDREDLQFDYGPGAEANSIYWENYTETPSSTRIDEYTTLEYKDGYFKVHYYKEKDGNVYTSNTTYK